MAVLPHPDPPDAVPAPIRCAVLTISDSRSRQSDRSGQFLHQALHQAGHVVIQYEIVPDDPNQIHHQLRVLSAVPQLQVVICTGGTGIAPRDQTYDVVSKLLERELPGFGELFRMLSYQEIGSRAIASRATAGVYAGLLLFVLPGSTQAVKLATEKLILPELRHLCHLLDPQ
jgi:molybdenum cofactor biosynthesis protein B